MKSAKFVLMGVCVSILATSCGSTGEGAVNGAYFGTIFGSAIGGLMGGYHGRDVGTIVGMATGAAAGAAVGSSNERKREERIHGYHERIHKRENAKHRDYQTDDSGFDETNSGDDRLYDFHSSDYTGTYTAAQPTTMMPTQSSIEDVTGIKLPYSNAIEIRNARFVDDANDYVLKRGETGKIIFEIVNVSDRVLHNVVPTVVETTGNRHIKISPSIHIESIAPGQALRYTAIVLAKKSLKNGEAKFSLSTVQDNKTIGKVTEFCIRTAK